MGRLFGPAADPYGNHSNSTETSIHGGAYHATGDHNNLFFQYSSNNSCWWQTKIIGSYTDGGPQYADWDGDSFGSGDLKHVYEDLTNAYTPHNPENLGYLGHPSFDRWGQYFILGSSQDAGDGCIWGWNCNPGSVLASVTTGGNPPWYDSNNGNYPLNYNQYDGQHHSWTAWSDYLVGTDITGTDYLVENSYKNTTQTGKTNTVAQHRFADVERPSPLNNYNVFPMAIQSPDGTKVLFNTVLFHSDYDGDSDDDDYQSIVYSVAYYPYPPTISSLSVSSGTATIQLTDPKYCDRVWPTGGSNIPPAREVASFRIWKSTDKITWTPIEGTVTNTVWSRFNFKTGAWSGNAYETGTFSLSNGTWYIATTSVETSGLESHKVGNIYTITVSGGNGTGSQDTAYPSDPGCLSNISQKITSTYQPSMVRHYNIYAEDGAAPTINQVNRVASISTLHGNTWIDWLGNTSGTTQYRVTAVDTQGNESEVGASYTHKLSPATADGQYTLSWSNTMVSNSGRVLSGVIIQ
jgi:hypothetical protein